MDEINIRSLSLEILLEMEKTQEYGNLLIRNVLDKYDYLDTSRKAFLKRLTEGVVERRIQLDYVLECYSSVPVKKMKPVIRQILRMGVYQILFMDGVPDSAACNEAVKLAVRKKFQSLKGFVNGVLRKVVSNKNAVPWPERVESVERYFSIVYSMPEWIVRMWITDYGEEKTEQILRGLMEKRPVTIRLSAGLNEEERQQVVDGLQDAGCGPQQHPFLAYAYTLEKSEGIAALPGFAEGKFTVQDVSSMLVAECCGVVRKAEKSCRLVGMDETADLPGEKENDSQDAPLLVDVCAAPGGKTVHAAECLPNARVIARDLSEHKAFYIMDNIERMNLPNVEVQVWDATVSDPELIGQADYVIADLPCSGLGVIGRKADIKYRVSSESLAEVAALQREILTVVQEYVRPGGILVYSTCTINREENEENAAWFAGNFPFEPVCLKAQISQQAAGAAAALKTDDAQIQLLPGIHPTDGFFISCFRRKEEA